MNNSILRAEAAHYVLLRRISSSLRHKLVGPLQPIGLLAALASKQLTSVSPNLATVNGSIAKVQNQTRDAITYANETLTWLTGEESAAVELNEGLSKCVELIRTDCTMHGVTISAKASSSDIWVSRRALRIVVTASLIAMVDVPPRPSQISVRSLVSGNKVEIHFDLNFEPLAEERSNTAAPRSLDYEDVKALADFEGVECYEVGHPSKFNCRFQVVSLEKRKDCEGRFIV